ASFTYQVLTFEQQGRQIFIAPTGPGGALRAYYREAGPMTWDQARVFANQQTFGGVQGHLATITSAFENEVVRGIAGGSAWIGLTDNTSISTLDGFNLGSLGTFENGNNSGGLKPQLGTEPVAGEVGAGWKWVTGEAFTYFNWGDGEPNNAGDGEDAAQITGA